MSAGYAPGGEPPLNQPWYGIGFGDALKRWTKKFFVFNGRASRGEYWWVTLFVVIVSAVLGALLGAIGLGTGEAVATGTSFSSSGPTTMISYLISLVFFVLTLGLLVRRLHDANFSGRLALLLLIPCLGPLIVLILTILPSKPEGARFDTA